jgi:hypothetical protein
LGSAILNTLGRHYCAIWNTERWRIEILTSPVITIVI